MSHVGRRIEELPSPGLVVDLQVVRNNCSRMLETAKKWGVQLRGHVKTHKTIEGALLQTGGTKRFAIILCTDVEHAELMTKNSKGDQESVWPRSGLEARSRVA